VWTIPKTNRKKNPSDKGGFWKGELEDSIDSNTCFLHIPFLLFEFLWCPFKELRQSAIIERK
jgi:hypothetical protein